jgi:hypothetical protein
MDRAPICRCSGNRLPLIASLFQRLNFAIMIKEDQLTLASKFFAAPVDKTNEKRLLYNFLSRKWYLQYGCRFMQLIYGCSKQN